MKETNNEITIQAVQRKSARMKGLFATHDIESLTNCSLFSKQKMLVPNKKKSKFAASNYTNGDNVLQNVTNVLRNNYNTNKQTRQEGNVEIMDK